MESFMIWMQNWIGPATIISAVVAVMCVMAAVAFFLGKVEKDDQPGLKHHDEDETDQKYDRNEEAVGSGRP